VSYADPVKKRGASVWLILVVALHLAIGYALATGDARETVGVVNRPLEAKIVVENTRRIEFPAAPPPPRLKFSAPPPPSLPALEIRVAVAVTPAATTIVPMPTMPTMPMVPMAPTMPAAPERTPVLLAPQPAVSGFQPPSLAPAASPELVRTPPVLDVERSCDKPEYPSLSLRAGETGTVRLGFLVGVDGLAAESKVVRSSGYRRLDEAARTGLVLCRFKPATVDGKPEISWAQIDYVWKID